jgi:hypothetical protein
MNYRITLTATCRKSNVELSTSHRSQRYKRGTGQESNTSPIGRRLFVDMDVARLIATWTWSNRNTVSWNDTGSLSRAARLIATRMKCLSHKSDAAGRRFACQSDAAKLLAIVHGSNRCRDLVRGRLIKCRKNDVSSGRSQELNLAEKRAPKRFSRTRVAISCVPFQIKRL